MPDHVNNHILVEGDESEIKRLVEQAKTDRSEFDFNAFVPMPKHVFRGDLGKKEKALYPGELNWYEWSLAHWGTKWNAYQVCVESPLIAFQTAWSVPTPFLIKLSQQFPSLKFTDEWIEETLESAGVLVLQNGKVLQQEEETWHSWRDKQSKLIHPLNMKYSRNHYVSYLEECGEDEDEGSAYNFYLVMAKSGISAL